LRPRPHPKRRRAASDIRSGVHGGSQTSATSIFAARGAAARIAALAFSMMTSPSGQAGEVIVMLTLTSLPRTSTP
jgi:hypothetical protein